MAENDVISSIQTMMNKFNDEKIHKKFRKWNKTMAFEFTDVSKTFHSVITAGTPSEVVEGKPEKAVKHLLHFYRICSGYKEHFPTKRSNCP